MKRGKESSEDLKKEVVELRLGLRNLVNKLNLIGANPQYLSVWTLHMVHGGHYTGPTWEAEKIAAEKLLGGRG